MATKIFPSANDVAPTVGDGKTGTEANLTAWLKALVVADFVLSGLTVPASSASLTLGVALGQAMLKGYWVTKDASENVTCTDAATNYIYLVLTRDGAQKVTGATYQVNTTGVTPTDGMLLATAVAAGGQITSTADQRVTKFGVAALLGSGTGPSLVYLRVTAGVLEFSADNGATWLPAGFVDPTTARGDMIRRGASAAERFALGASGAAVVSDGTDPGWGAVGAAYGGGLVKIAETILGSAAASITFSSIPATYRHLMMLLAGRAGSGAYNLDDAGLRLNGDTGANYDYLYTRAYMNGNATTVEAFATTYIRLGDFTGTLAPAGAASGVQIIIPDYARATWQKTLTSHLTAKGNNSTQSMASYHVAGWWRNSAAISSVTLILTTGDNFATGTVATLYGVAV